MRHLSDFERGTATPTLGTLAQIAQVLGVGVDYFVPTPHATNAHTIADQRTRFSVEGCSIVYERIGAEFPGSRMSSFILDIPPGFRSETTQHKGEEIAYVIGGSITLVVAGEQFRLNTGDSLHYLGIRPHSWYNSGEVSAKVLWTGTLELFHGRPAAERPERPTVLEDGHDGHLE